MKKALMLVALVAAIFSCDTPTTTRTITENPVKVGDTLAGGFTVTVADTNSTGYLATRDADLDDNGTIEDSEMQGLVYGRFTTDITLTEDRIWTLNGPVFIGNDNSGNATITIEAGTTIKGSSSATAPGMLVITRGSMIDAQGTSSAPIVFTSEKAVGSRAPGDWGGVIINGNARINDGDDNGEAEGEGNTGLYGGDDDTDDSGIMTYCRIEFAGVLFTADNELNGLALQGVGSGTELSYIQVHMNADDGVEFFGGSADIDHVVITRAQDDSLDWTSGWTGTAQYFVIQQDTGSDEGIEADSNKTPANLPVSSPTLANFTIIGAGANRSAKFRRGTEVAMYNSILANNQYSIDATDEVDAGTLSFDGVVTVADLDGAVAAYVSGTDNNLQVADFAATGLAASLTDTDYTNDSFVPTAAITGYTAATLPAGLGAGAFAGAIEPNGTDWTAGWTTNANN